MRRSWCAQVVSLLALASVGPAASGVVWFVKPGATGAGTSWANPIDLQGALAAAAPGDEVRVAAGTYKPGAARNSYFLLNGEILHGGYPAAGGPVADPVANPTILSGDIGVVGMAADNCYHVVWSWGGIIDGFIIRGGNADGLGGGAADSIYGGGLYVRGGTIIDRCKIVRNRAHSGGGVYYFTNQPGSGLTVLRRQRRPKTPEKPMPTRRQGVSQSGDLERGRQGRPYVVPGRLQR